MAASSGFVWVPMAIRIARHAVKRTTALVRAKLAESSRPLESQLQPIFVRNTPRQPIHPAAFLRQSKGRWYTTHSAVNAAFRRFTTAARLSAQSGVKYDRTSFPKSAIGAAVTRLPARAPFASTLRPNLTGGAIPRTAGGYATGAGRAGGARYFSHTPAAPAQVVNNVSIACRAFFMSGGKAHYVGSHPVTGEKRYAATTSQNRNLAARFHGLARAIPGSSLDFEIVQDLPLAVNERSQISIVLAILNQEHACECIDCTIIESDLRRLRTLGDFPCVRLPNSFLRVLFPGCDASTLETLCNDLTIQRGIVKEDDNFDSSSGVQAALKFPFAPSESDSIGIDPYEQPIFYRKFGQLHPQSMLSSDSSSLDFDMISTQSNMSDLETIDQDYQSQDFEDIEPSSSEFQSFTSPSVGLSDYSSLHASEADQDDVYFNNPRDFSQGFEIPNHSPVDTGEVSGSSSQDADISSRYDVSQYQGMEGVLRFMAQIDDSPRGGFLEH
ncbi:MAG: NAD-dependent histone deacetylase sir2 [Chaenotheca gracillima]|nr:MAG: NAD-dependent histone deacetylase sir2 [Chaenotheca gracillima]